MHVWPDLLDQITCNHRAGDLHSFQAQDTNDARGAVPASSVHNA